MNLGEEARPDLIDRLRIALTEKTEKAWEITLTKDPGPPTKAEIAAQKQAELWAEVSEGPLVKFVLESFPGSKIETITER